MSWVTEDRVQDEDDDEELDLEVEDFDSDVLESDLLESSLELSSSPFSSLLRVSVKLVKSLTSVTTPLTALTPLSISFVIFERVLVIQATLWIMSPAILNGSGINPLATNIRSRFVEPLQGLEFLLPPSEFRRFSAGGSMPLIALIASSALSFAGLSVHMLIIGITSTLILLDKTLALELASVPVGTKVVGGAVVATGTGVV